MASEFPERLEYDDLGGELFNATLDDRGIAEVVADIRVDGVGHELARRWNAHATMRAALKRARETVAFLPSVVNGRETWTDTCEQLKAATIDAIGAALKEE